MSNQPDLDERPTGDAGPCDLQDCRERIRRLEQLLHRAQKLDAVGKLASGIVHDFNNILAVVLGEAEMAAVHLAADHRAWASLHEIKAAVRRASALTQQLLAFTRHQAREPHRVALDQLVMEMQRMMARLLGSSIRIHLDLDGHLGTIEADAGQIEHAILNLAINARDAMPEGGSLAIEIRNVELGATPAGTGCPALPAGSYVMLAVHDTGSGMDEATRASAFEPFFTTKEVGKGTGLGLSTVRDIVQQSGGAITVESEPGRGATFRLYFPRRDPGAGR
jgi:two-component system, cell cycle sensor histidine kinase and response regulator CckA